MLRKNCPMTKVVMKLTKVLIAHPALRVSIGLTSVFILFLFFLSGGIFGCVGFLFPCFHEGANHQPRGSSGFQIHR
jgi:hypothetical protein